MAQVIFAMAPGSVILFPEDTSNTNFSYVPVLTYVCVGGGGGGPGGRGIR